MIDTQRALNLGTLPTPEVVSWLESGATWTKGSTAIDPVFGCSVQLPSIMVSAERSAELHN